MTKLATATATAIPATCALCGRKVGATYMIVRGRAGHVECHQWGPGMLPPAELTREVQHELRRQRDRLNQATPPGRPAHELARAFALLDQLDETLKGLAE